MNKNIKNVSVETYHGSNIEVVNFELNGLKYYARKEWNNQGETTSIIYGRTMKNEYYDTIGTLSGGYGGMNNKSVECIFGKMPKELYNSIAHS